MAISKNSWRMLLINLAIMAVVTIGLIFLFFMVYLPQTTKHGETITVPDLLGLSLEELTDVVTRRQLRFEITADSMYSSEFPPLTVLKQFPLANSKVKENRRIYISLNAKYPPMVRMPQLVDGSVKSAQLVLKSFDLLLGDISYVPDIAANAVIRQFYQGQPIEAGTYIPKGVKIDLEVGDGLGNQNFESPMLIGLTLEDAQFAIIGSGLKVGEIIYSSNKKAEIEKKKEDGEIEVIIKEIAPGSVFKQRPAPNSTVRIGQVIDIWIVQQDASSNELDKIF